jgi:hypothetical protein
MRPYQFSVRFLCSWALADLAMEISMADLALKISGHRKPQLGDKSGCIHSPHLFFFFFFYQPNRSLLTSKCHYLNKQAVITKYNTLVFL